MSDEDFIDHLKKVIRHLFCFLGPYACDNDPNNRDLVRDSMLGVSEILRFLIY